MLNIIQKRKIWLSFSGILVSISVIFLFIWGLNFGLDFTGGALLEVRYENNRPSISEVQTALADLNLSSLLIQPVGEDNMIFRFKDTSEEKHQLILERLNEFVNAEININNDSKEDNVEPEESEEKEDEDEKVILAGVEELRYDSVGPSIGQELKIKSINAIIVVLICIVLYIAWAFRQVSKPVASWKYGISATIALFHDVIIVLGIFAFLGQFYNVEINIAFVAAILTVLGYSVNDTIVVFDRIRENLPKSDLDFENTINLSVNQIITRSINTSITTLLVLLSILFFGGSSIKDFILALSLGVLVGTYSSIFLASPLLVLWERFKKN